MLLAATPRLYANYSPLFVVVHFVLHSHNITLGLAAPGAPLSHSRTSLSLSLSRFFSSSRRLPHEQGPAHYVLCILSGSAGRVRACLSTLSLLASLGAKCCCCSVRALSLPSLSRNMAAAARSGGGRG